MKGNDREPTVISRWSTPGILPLAAVADADNDPDPGTDDSPEPGNLAL